MNKPVPPLVSVIIPTYNRASMIKRAVESVLAQDYEAMEIIIVDDASSDNTASVVGKIVDKRIQYIVCRENKGAAAARNTGIKAAKGELIAFLDSDDEYLPGKLRAQICAFDKLGPEAGFVFNNYCEISEARSLRVSFKIKSGYVHTGKVFPASIFCNTPSSWLVRRSCFDVVGLFDEDLWTLEDLDMFARLVRKVRSYFMAEVLVHKYVHTSQQGRVPDKYAEHTGERIIEKWLPEMRRDRRFLFKFYTMMAKDMARSGKKQKTYYFLRQAYFLNLMRFDLLGKMIRLSIRKSINLNS